MMTMGDTMVRSFGYGVYLAEAPDGLGEAESAEAARAAVGGISPVLESWPDPGSPRHHLVATESGHPTSWYEAGVTSEDGVLDSAVRSARESPPGSVVRARLDMVSVARAKHGYEKIDV